MRTDEIILAHAKSYPLMQPLDAVKLCYQACFGAGHLIADADAARERLQYEYTQTKPDDTELLEALPGGYARLNLGAAKRQGISPELVFALFSATAAITLGDDAPARFRDMLDCVRDLSERGSFAFTRAELDSFLAGYLTGEPVPPPVSHSEEYRQAYTPSYRVIDARFVPLFELCKAIFAHLHTGRRIVVALDGRCASGKSTAAELLRYVFSAEVIHCDDFFLPFELRSPERYAEPGGNIHYERFTEEVVSKLPAGELFEYGVFDCSEGRVTHTARVGSSPIVIVEGAYSTSPRFGRYYTLSAFFDISPELQKSRIVARDGERAWKSFEERWIPLEEAYITATGADKRADIIVRAQ